MIFKEKDRFLELYNAMNGTSYDDPEELVVTTLENAIYINMKNDVSYFIHDKLSLYEHQSTRNPNIPLRNLFYVADIYSALTRNRNLYGTKLVRIPKPVFVEFYNGAESMPERSVLRLSEAYEGGGCEKPGVEKKDVLGLELETLVLNINPGYNEDLKKSCPALRDYMKYVGKVREYSRYMEFGDAVERSVEECIREGILAEFLKKNKAEVIKVSIYEFDEEQYKRWVKAEGREEGLARGRDRINELNRRLLADGREQDMIRAVTDMEFQQKLLEEYSL